MCYFIEPMCQDVAPLRWGEAGPDFGVRQKLFKTLDKALADPASPRYLFLLGEAGMGKTTSLKLYHSHHLKRLRRDFEISLVSLRLPNSDERIAEIASKPKTILFLDGLDEDIRASVDYTGRLHCLLSATAEFRKVLITARTNFFREGGGGPFSSGAARIPANYQGEGTEIVARKIYLSPLTSKEMNRLIRKALPFASRRLDKFPKERPPALLSSLPVGLRSHPSALSQVDAVFAFLGVFIPCRIMKEDAGDARELISGLIEKNAPAWMVYTKLTSSVYWILVAGLREVLAATKKRLD